MHFYFENEVHILAFE